MPNECSRILEREKNGKSTNEKFLDDVVNSSELHEKGQVGVREGPSGGLVTI